MKDREFELALRRHLELHGWRVHLVNKASGIMIPGTGTWRPMTHDLFNTWDILAIHAHRGKTMLIQATTVAQAAAHRKKILENGPWPENAGVEYALVVDAEQKDAATGRISKALRVQFIRNGAWDEPTSMDWHPEARRKRKRNGYPKEDPRGQAHA